MITFIVPRMSLNCQILHRLGKIVMSRLMITLEELETQKTNALI
jgi:HD-like signal output (HDOD) protein